MSNIYIQEPPTNGKVLLVTSAGEIDVELWSKEAPKACRNFVQLCLEGYYDDTIFHRMVPEFIVQGGDPSGTGEGGESIYGQPFKDETHSRLRFVRRGLVAMANAGRNDNGSQFFFTLGQTPELQDKHTIFGKIVGDTLYNMLKLGEGETDPNDRPIYPYRILKTKVLNNPFEDIIPRVSSKKSRSDEPSRKKKQSKSKATKNFKLLSFGEEAEEDEQETDRVAQNLRQKGKSSHDLLDDARLSATPVTAVEQPSSENLHSSQQLHDASESSDSDDNAPQSKKLKNDDHEELEDDEQIPEKTTKEKLREEVRALKRDLAAAKRRLKQPIQPAKQTEAPKDSEPVAQYKAERHKYEERKAQIGSAKSGGRESATLALLSKFQQRLHAAKEACPDEVNTEKKDAAPSSEENDEDINDGVADEKWLAHKLEFDARANKVLDANVHDVNRYEIFDPRNPMNKRRREADKKKKR